jgi:hypothetical protein
MCADACHLHTKRELYVQFKAGSPEKRKNIYYWEMAEPEP